LKRFFKAATSGRKYAAMRLILVDDRPATRVQLCPAAALAAVAAGSNVAAQGLLPVWILEQSAETARQARHHVPADAVVQVEKWLVSTSGSELRKAKSLETALRAVTHVAFVWSSCADCPLHDDSLANATTRPENWETDSDGWQTDSDAEWDEQDTEADEQSTSGEESDEGPEATDSDGEWQTDSSAESDDQDSDGEWQTDSNAESDEQDTEVDDESMSDAGSDEGTKSDDDEDDEQEDEDDEEDEAEFFNPELLHCRWGALGACRMRQAAQAGEAANGDEISQLETKTLLACTECEGVCAVCQSEWEEGDEVRVLPCGHQFHTGCVDRWLGRHKACCPLCKADVRPSWDDVSTQEEWDPVTATWQGVVEGADDAGRAGFARRLRPRVLRRLRLRNSRLLNRSTSAAVAATRARRQRRKRAVSAACVSLG
jgi:hypothetical protein